MDTFGPISDNANGIFEMSGALKEDMKDGDTEASRIVAKLDAVVDDRHTNLPGCREPTLRELVRQS